MKQYKRRILPVLAAVLLMGCSAPGQEAVSCDGNGIILDKNDKVTQVIVESFDQSYYNETELKAQIEEQIGSLNTGEKEEITLKEFGLGEDKMLRVEIDYDRADLYTAFNHKELFVGTLSKMTAAGMKLPVMKDDQGQTVGEEALSVMGEKKVAVIEEPLQVVVPGKIIAVSDNMDITETGKAVLNADMQQGFVIYE
ncbi:MAG: hypothetical protein K5739_01475 [Lachnospiraceae bacterium]|nr:hypothetical protein [Lachnospiraceae bacterium]